MKQRGFLVYAAAAVLATVLGVSACGGSSTSSNTSSPGATVQAGQSLKGVSFYHPSTVQTHTEDSAVLVSPDHVTTVSDYYVRMAKTHGWQTVSKSVTPYNGDLTLERSGQGATISVAPSGSGSVISISTYRTQ